MAVDARTVREVALPPVLTRVPGAPPALAGIASLRGAVTPIVSAAVLLGEDTQSAGASDKVVVLDLDQPLGLRVDAVLGLDVIEADAGGGGRLFVRDGDAGRVMDLNGLLTAAFSTFTSRPAGTGATRTAARSEAINETAADGRALLTFTLNDQTYGLPLDMVVEATTAPQSVQSLPRNRTADLGVTPYRERVLPVIDLAALLGLSSDRPLDQCRLVVARFGGASIGLVVDQLRSILRLPESVFGPVPAVLNRGGGEAGLEAIARLGDGLGVVSVLAPERLFKDEALAQVLRDAVEDGETMKPETTEDRQLERFVIFRLGAETYGFPIEAVEEVVSLPDALTRVPRAPAFIEGVLNLRGRAVPVIDQTKRFGCEGAASETRRVIVTRISGLQAGFVVDAVSEIAAVSGADIAPASGLLSNDRPVFDRVATLDMGARVILIVDPKALLDQAEADLLAALETKRPTA